MEIGEIKFVDMDTKYGKTVVDVFPGGGDKIVFPDTVAAIKLAECGKVFKGVKEIVLPPKLKLFFVKNTQFPSLRRITGNCVISIASVPSRDTFRHIGAHTFFFDESTRTLYEAGEDPYHYLLTNVFDTAGTETYKSECFKNSYAHLSVSDYAFEGTQFSDVVLYGMLQDVAETAFDGSRFKDLQKDNTFFLLKNGTQKTLLDVNHPEREVDMKDLTKLVLAGTNRRMSSDDIRIAARIDENYVNFAHFLSPAILGAVRSLHLTGDFTLTRETSINLARMYNVESISADGSKRYRTVDNVLFSKDGRTLMYYPPKREAAEYTVPESVLRIATTAFYRPEYLREINIPQSCRVFDKGAFSCMELDKLNIPESLVSNEAGWLVGSKIKKLVMGKSISLNQSNRISDTKIKQGIKCLGVDSINMQSDAKHTAAIDIPESVVWMSPNAVWLTLPGTLDFDFCFAINAYSHTENVFMAAYNAITSIPICNKKGDTLWASICFNDTGCKIPVADSMSRWEAEKIAADIDDKRPYAEVIDETLKAITPASLRCKIALSLLPSAKGETVEALTKYIKKASNSFAKSAVQSGDKDGLISILNTGLCSSATVQYIIDKVDKDKMCEVVAIASEMTKKRTKRLSL